MGFVRHKLRTGTPWFMPLCGLLHVLRQARTSHTIHPPYSLPRGEAINSRSGGMTGAAIWLLSWTPWGMQPPAQLPTPAGLTAAASCQLLAEDEDSKTETSWPCWVWKREQRRRPLSAG